MLRNSSKKVPGIDPVDAGDSAPVHVRPWVLAIVLPLWVAGSFILASVFINFLLDFLVFIGVSFSGINAIIFNTSAAVVVYGLTLLIAVMLPKLLFKSAITTRGDIGLQRLPNWKDIFVTPVGFIAYFILSAILTALATSFSWFDIDQAQNTGFSGVSFGYEYVLAFFALVVLAPVAEEILFRGYLFGKLKNYVPVWFAILLTSVLFGVAHGAWNVGIDTFALSVVLCILREVTGSLWPSILLHSLKNGLAYYLLFINPVILHTL